MPELSDTGSEWIPVNPIEIEVVDGQMISATKGMKGIMSKILSIRAQTTVVLHVGTVPGAPPDSPGAVGISTAPDNRLTTGADGKLFVPEILIDPLAYYILSKG